MLIFDMKSLLKMTALGVIAIAALCESARAGTLSMDADNGARMTIDYDGGGWTFSHPTGIGDIGLLSGVLTDTSFNPGLVNVPLDLYCVDLDVEIAYSTSYPGTSVNSIAEINSLPPYPGIVTNADQVASLLNQYAASATTDDLRLGLQAAIWKVEYGTHFDLVAPGVGSVTTAATYLAYTTDLSTVTPLVGAISDVLWINPDPDGFVQGLAGVTDLAAVPEPSTFVLLGIGLPFFASVIRRRRKS